MEKQALWTGQAGKNLRPSLTKYFTAEYFTELSLDLISCGAKWEGLIQGHCGEKVKLVTHAAILISAECHIIVS